MRSSPTTRKETEPGDLVDYQVMDYRVVERQEHSFT